MALPRVYDVAKELGIDTKVALAKLEELGEYVKSGSSTIAPPIAKKLRAAFPDAKPAEETKKVAKPKAAAKKTAVAEPEVVAEVAKAPEETEAPKKKTSRLAPSSNRYPVPPVAACEPSHPLGGGGRHPVHHGQPQRA